MKPFKQGRFAVSSLDEDEREVFAALLRLRTALILFASSLLSAVCKLREMPRVLVVQLSSCHMFQTQSGRNVTGNGMISLSRPEFRESAELVQVHHELNVASHARSASSISVEFAAIFAISSRSNLP